MANNQLDSLDYKILESLTINARKPYLEIARECGVSGAAIHQRIQKLQTLGIIKSTEAHIDPTSIGYETCAYIGFFLNDTSKFDEIVKKLHEIPEVVECHLTTGKYDLLIKLFAKNNSHLLKIIQSKIQTLGLARTETLISFQEVFRRQIPMGKINDNN